MDSRRQWQATILFDQDAKQSAIVYGESLVALREAARTWLRDNKPTFFRNGIITYFYSDGTYPSTYADLGGVYQFLEEGWYREDHLRERNHSFNSNKIRDFEEAVVEFTESVLIPCKGPDYQDVVIVNGVLHPHLIKTVRRESDEDKANQFIRRGWNIISLDFYGSEDYYGKEIRSRTTIYILGHPEENAI